MGGWGAAVWGLAGGSVVEALALHAMIRADRSWSWRKPIPQGLVAYLISVVLRTGAGAGLAAAAAGSGQVSGAFAAFGLGVAAPLVVEKLAMGVQLTGAAPDRAPMPAPPETDVPAGRGPGLLARRPDGGKAADLEPGVVDDAG